MRRQSLSTRPPRPPDTRPPDGPTCSLPTFGALHYHPRMKALFVVVALGIALGSGTQSARGQDDQYIGIYATIQQADALLNAGEANPAVARYLEAQAALKRLQTAYPEWNPKVVNFRLNYVAAKLAAATARVSPAPGAPKVAELPGVAATPSAPGAPQPVVAPSLEVLAELRALKEQVGQLEADKGLLEAKLKEALAAQPVAFDPRELVRAGERIKSLEKENDLLKISLDQERATKPAGDTAELERLKRQLVEAGQTLTAQKSRAETLALEKAALQQRLDELSAVPTPAPAAELEQTRLALTETGKQLADQSERNRQLAAEREELQRSLRALRADAEAAAALRAENELLKKQVAGHTAASPRGEGPRDLQQARAQLAALQSDLDILRLEKIALENRVKTMSRTTAGSAALTPAPAAVDSERVRQLERDRDELQRKLDTAVQELAGRRDKPAAARVQEMTDQLTTLRARLEMIEARPVPYSPEELALMKAPSSRLASADPLGSRKSVKELPAGAVALVAEAQRSFAERRFDEAEQKYLQVLRQDERNVVTLANLAIIQMELDRLDEAERHARQAVAVAPNDAYSHLVLGQIKLRQRSADEAMDALSRAAQLDARSAEIQNFLGIALSQKGLRAPAETALRRAIQLDPGYASAHNNLAVIYLNQNPPMVELARWHYQKALNAGHAKNSELEKALNAKETPPGQP